MVSGRDVIVQAEAGMGKTSTIAIAILQNIDTDLLEVQALVLSPTRELATQTQSVITALGDYSNVECHAFVGGTPIREDIKKLDNNSVHVISGTAGRVLDMMKRKKLRTQNIKMLLVEEADEMLNKGFRQKVDKGFREQIEETYRHLPPVAQVVFLGITLPESVLEVTATLMRDPIRILFKRDELTLEGIKQYFVAVKNENQKFDSIISLFDTLKLDCALVLCNSKRKVGAPEPDGRRRDSLIVSGEVAPLAEKLRSAKFTVSCMVASQTIEPVLLSHLLPVVQPNAASGARPERGRFPRWKYHSSDYHSRAGPRYRYARNFACHQFRPFQVPISSLPTH